MHGLNVVALISGGKDSLFTLLHCQANNHKVVALANLHPPEDEAHERVDDMGSYMYQTIGHAIIPLYEQALGLPLYRQEIFGSAVNQNKSYGLSKDAARSTDDETECLVPLLRKVMLAHPEVNAISTGAILSDYQRTRVESVALRLGLIPISYLWQWPNIPPQTPTSLLEDMAGVGQDARIVLVASGGLDETYLWQNVSERRSIVRLSQAAERFGTSGDGAVLGEGGEFETLAIDGPPPLWKGRINVDPVDMDVVPGDAGSFSLRIKRASVETKAQSNTAQIDLRIPALFDTEFADLLAGLMAKTVKLGDESGTISTESVEPTANLCDPENIEEFPASTSQSMYTIPKLLGKGSTAAEQTHSIMDTLLEKLAERGHSSRNIIYTTIVLRDMGEFASVNTVYGSYFTEPNPPARLTIACAQVLPQDAQLLMGFTCADVVTEGLHVQSRSYWAPANIGPYSQAIKVSIPCEQTTHNALVLVAGQIPLVPASMELVASPEGNTQADFVHEVVLSLQHLVRVGRVMKVRRWCSAIAFIAGPYSDKSAVRVKVSFIQDAWKSIHLSSSSGPEASEEDDDFDVWDIRNRRGQAYWRTDYNTRPEPTTESESVESVPRLHIICVDSLPRGSSIEWVSYGQTDGNSTAVASDHLHSLLPLFQHQMIHDSLYA